jgi:hypothetical protein
MVTRRLGNSCEGNNGTCDTQVTLSLSVLSDGRLKYRRRTTKPYESCLGTSRYASKYMTYFAGLVGMQTGHTAWGTLGVYAADSRTSM